MRNWLLVGVLGAAMAACGPGESPVDGGDAGRDVTSQDTARPDVPGMDMAVVDVTPPPPDVTPPPPDVTPPPPDTMPPPPDVTPPPPDVTPPPPDVPTMDVTPPPPDMGVPDMGRPDTTSLDATPPPDAPADTLVPRDVPTDVPRGTTPLFGRCTGDLECRDSDGFCVTSYPGGLCSRGCASDAACGTGGRCFMGACLPRCSLGGSECSTSTACFVIDNVDTTRRACFPSCWATPPAGTLACTAPLTCDEYGGDCSSTPSTGALNGQPCTMNTDCRGGRCSTELNMGSPTGWLNGYCFSTGRVPSLFDYAVDAPIPRSNCPSNSVAIPADQLGDEGDVAICLLACTSSAGCRPGYECAFLTDGMGGRSTNGYCAPFNCLAPGAIACPAGTTCRNVTMPGGTTRGVCAR